MNIEVIRPASRLNSSGNVKITSICYGREKLYVGFSTGDFSIYDVDVTMIPEPRKAPSITSFKSLNDIRTFFVDNKSSSFEHDMSFSNINGDNSSLTGIEIISHNLANNRIIFAITSSDVIRIFEKVGGHLNLIQTVEESRSFGTYYLYEVNEKRYMALGNKKKLIVLEMVFKSRNLFQFKKVHEVAVKERIKRITSINLHLGTQLIIGVTNDFLLVDINDGFKVTGLLTDEMADESYYYFTHSSFSYFGLSGSGPNIWVLKLTDDHYCLIKDSQVANLYYTDQKLSVKTSNIRLSATPVFVSLISPSYLLVVYNKKVEILEFDTGDLIQKIHHQINSNTIPVYVDDHFIFLGANADLLQFNILTHQQQIDQYLRFAETTRYTKDPKTDLSLIGLKKAITFVGSIDEEDEFFGGSRVGKEKRKQLMLRDLHKQRAFILFERYGKYHESVVEICSEWLVSYKEVLVLFPDFLKASFYDDNTIETVEKSKSVIKKMTVEELDANKINTVTSADSATEVEPDNKSRVVSVARIPSTLFGQTKSQNVRKFIKAINNLIIYLTDQRRIHLSFLNDEKFSWKGIDVSPPDLYDFITPEMQPLALEQIALEIDTSLFLCYFYCKPMLLGPLLRLPNNKCDSNIVNRCLLSNVDKSTGYIKELMDFYFGRSLHEEALKMLYDLARDKHDISWEASQLSIQYLQKLSNEHLDLVFKYAKWLIIGDKRVTEGGENGLIEREEPQQEQDQRDEESEQEEESDSDFTPIIEKVQAETYGKLIFMNDTYECESYDNFKVLDYLTNEIANDDLTLQYLEWIVFSSDLQNHSQESKTLSKFHTKLVLVYLQNLQKTPTSDPGFESSPYYKKLYDFLKTTSLYEPWTVLKYIPTNEVKLLRFTIFVYKRLGEHDKAIDVLYNQLEDLDDAIAYCSEIYTQDNKDTGKRLLHKLMEDLLMDYGENMNSIGKLLDTQGQKMDSLRVLTSLPPSFPVTKISRFLDQQIRSTSKTLIDSRVAGQLYKVGSIKLNHELVTRQNQSYLIDSSKKLCPICKKRLGYSVFTAVNDQIVHYACYQNDVSRK